MGGRLFPERARSQLVADRLGAKRPVEKGRTPGLGGPEALLAKGGSASLRRPRLGYDRNGLPNRAGSSVADSVRRKARGR
jgi:hypothetical protein